MKILVLYGGTSNERDVSIQSGKSIIASLSKKNKVSGYDFNGDYNKLKEKLNDFDLVFNALHGGEGENGTVQKFLEDSNILFTGSSSASSDKCMNKNLSKEICNQNSILTPRWLYFEDEVDFGQISSCSFKSMVIKPADEGSSIGLSIIKNFSLDKKKEFDESVLKCSEVTNKILIEEYIDGRELTVGILNDTILPALEIIPDNQYYDYECKYSKGKSKYVVPAKINEDLSNKLKKISLKVYKLLNCSNYARVDFRLSYNNKIYFLEINTLPGFTSTSLFPKAANAISMNYDDVLDEIISSVKK